MRVNRLMLCLTVLGCAAGVGAQSARAADACAAIQAVTGTDPQHPNRMQRAVVNPRVAFGQVLNPDGAYAACLYSVGRVVLLEPQDGFTDLHYDSLRSTGPYFAYVYGQDDFNTNFFIESVDLRSGRYAHTIHFYDQYGDAGITDLVLKPNGSIAWIQVDSLGRTTLRKADVNGARVPRHGHSAKRFSLRIHGSRIYWQQGHKTRSMRLY